MKIPNRNPARAPRNAPILSMIEKKQASTNKPKTGAVNAPFNEVLICDKLLPKLAMSRANVELNAPKVITINFKLVISSLRRKVC